ncbi:Bcl-2-like protein 1 [Channa argus]|uniref:Bcl-2-like protein 1 n=1 Tax=Channa argus TaxID=215402 RepID=A0A6G1PGT9_CHAAH|nr:Bcl-2-like protein 1 [Channa argus]KAK2914679.1 hypothetical protein Q8A73_005273 [Channa argus]
MSYNNRELVEFFINYKLAQKNYPICMLGLDQPGGMEEKNNSAAANGLGVNSTNGSGQPETSPPPCGSIEAVKAALRDSAEEFELLVTQVFSDLSSQLDITPDTAYHSFKKVLDELFSDGVNWGRVVALFAFGGMLCVECIEKNRSELVSCIADWMTTYLDEHLNPWIQSQGGWDCFAEIFGQDAAAEARRTQEAVRRWVLVGVTLLMGVLVGVLIAKKR